MKKEKVQKHFWLWRCIRICNFSFFFWQKNKIAFISNWNVKNPCVLWVHCFFVFISQGRWSLWQMYFLSADTSVPVVSPISDKDTLSGVIVTLQWPCAPPTQDHKHWLFLPSSDLWQTWRHYRRQHRTAINPYWSQNEQHLNGSHDLSRNLWGHFFFFSFHITT